jgi:hypothetical protein
LTEKSPPDTLSPKKSNSESLSGIRICLCNIEKAKRAVEIAIEEDESKAEKFLAASLD